jgi:hypothetical protein
MARSEQIRKMFEAFGLGTEESRAAFSPFFPSSDPEESCPLILRLDNVTTPRAEDAHAELAPPAATDQG